MSSFIFLITMLMVMVAVAFFTILERKILSYIQIRKGPNKVSFMGILQPFSDALKLFNKSLFTTTHSNFSISSLTPSISMILALLLLNILPFNFQPPLDNLHNFLLFLVISSVSVYSILMVGWSTNSKYALLGSIRNIAQMISYEVSFFLIILILSLMINSYHLNIFMMNQHPLPFIIGLSIIFIMWAISCLAEVNRSPFDFAEGESELVSGFNVEYMGGWFALIFLAEYSSMIILSFLSSVMFFFPNIIVLILLFISMMISYLWVRGTFPRFRFDKLMYLNWKLILPISLIFMTPSMMLSIIN